MKHYLAFVASAACLSFGQLANGADDLFKPLQKAPHAADEEFFKVSNRQAAIAGHIVKLFVVKPDYLTASYQNDSNTSLFPKYTVRTYNRYGFLLGTAKVGISLIGGSPELEVGDVGGEKIHLTQTDITNVLKHTKLELPADFHEPAWVSLAEANTRLIKPDSK